MALILMVYGQDISETKAKFGTLMADIGLIHSTNLIVAYWYCSEPNIEPDIEPNIEPQY